MAGSVSRSAFSVLTENEVNERGDLVLLFLRKFFESLVVILNHAARVRRHNQLVGFSAKGPRYGMQYADAGASVAVQNAVNGGLANTGSVRDFFLRVQSRVRTHPEAEGERCLLFHAPFIRVKEPELRGCIRHVIDIQPETFLPCESLNLACGIAADVFRTLTPPVNQVLRFLNPFGESQLRVIEVLPDYFVEVITSYVVDAFHVYYVLPAIIT